MIGRELKEIIGSGDEKPVRAVDVEASCRCVGKESADASGSVYDSEYIGNLGNIAVEKADG